MPGGTSLSLRRRAWLAAPLVPHSLPPAAEILGCVRTTGLTRVSCRTRSKARSQLTVSRASVILVEVAFSAPRGRLAQLVRAPARQAGGRRFEPSTAHIQQPVDSTCQRVVLFDAVSTCGDGIRSPPFVGHACNLVHN